MPPKSSPKIKATPLKLYYGKKAIDARNRGGLMLLAGKRVITVPLRRGDAALQGVFRAARKNNRPEIITFYANGENIQVFAKDSPIGHVENGLADRELLENYRRLGIAGEAFDLIEQHIARRRAKAFIKNRALSLTTERADTYSFLQGRSYKPSLRVFRPGKNTLSKRLVSKGEWENLEEFHRVKVVGRDGKTRYWHGRIKKE